MDALKPCPFCGGRSEIKEGFFTKYVMCLKCEAMGPNLASREEIVAAWNARESSELVKAATDVFHGVSPRGRDAETLLYALGTALEKWTDARAQCPGLTPPAVERLVEAAKELVEIIESAIQKLSLIHI